MLIIHKIEKTHFSSSEAVIVQYILDQGDKIKDMTVAKIAQATYTSPPLLIRIAKKLGYSGWNEFKEAYLKELSYMYATSDIDASIPFVLGDDYMTIAKNIVLLQQETLQDTLSLLSHDALYQAMKYLRECKTIDLYGVSLAMLQAEDFAEKMFCIDKSVKICHLTGAAQRQAIMSDQTHCAILISYSGQTSFIIKVAKILRQKGVPIIAITSIADNELSKLAQVTLPISSREMLHTKIGEFASTQSIKYILDTLYGCIFSLDYQNNLDRRIEIAKEIDDKVSGYEFINEK